MPPKKSNPGLAKKSSPSTKSPITKKTTTASATTKKATSLTGTTTGASNKSEEASVLSPPTKKDVAVAEMTGISIPLKDIPAVLIKDQHMQIEESGRWPLVMDEAGRTSTFLKYQNCNFVDTLQPAEMQPESLRRCIIGAIRYGKPVIFDMADKDDMFETLSAAINEIMHDLMSLILNKKILEEENYMKLVKPQDGEEYQVYKFSPEFISNFRAIFVTKSCPANTEQRRLLFPIKIE